MHLRPCLDSKGGLKLVCCWLSLTLIPSLTLVPSLDDSHCFWTISCRYSARVLSMGLMVSMPSPVRSCTSVPFNKKKRLLFPTLTKHWSTLLWEHSQHYSIIELLSSCNTCVLGTSHQSHTNNHTSYKVYYCQSGGMLLLSRTPWPSSLTQSHFYIQTAGMPCMIIFHLKLNICSFNGSMYHTCTYVRTCTANLTCSGSNYIILVMSLPEKFCCSRDGPAATRSQQILQSF